MARSPNCTGAPLFKGRVDVSISYPYPDEVPLETPVALPTSEPAEAQGRFVVSEQHVPSMTPFTLDHGLVALICVAGCNQFNGYRGLYYRALKNGVSVATGSTLSNIAPYQWYTACYMYSDIQVGDVLELAIWGTGVYMVWDYKSLEVYLTRVGPWETPVCELGIYTRTPPSHRKGTPDTLNDQTGGFHISNNDMHEAEIVMSQSSWTTRRLVWSGAAYRLFRMENGDVTPRFQHYIDNTKHPVTPFLIVPSRIAYTPLNLRV